MANLVKQVGDAPGDDASFLRRIDVGDAGYCYLTFTCGGLLAQEPVDILCGSRQALDLFLGIEAFAKHRKRLTRAGLSIGKYCAVEAVHYIIHAILDVLEDFVLLCFLIEHSIIF